MSLSLAVSLGDGGRRTGCRAGGADRRPQEAASVIMTTWRASGVAVACEPCRWGHPRTATILLVAVGFNPPRFISQRSRCGDSAQLAESRA